MLRPEMARGMQKHLPNLTFAEVDGTHWILMQKPEETNAIIERWLSEVVLGGKTKL